MKRRYYYTIEISQNGIAWFVVGYYKTAQERALAMRERKEDLEQNGLYIVREGFDYK